MTDQPKSSPRFQTTRLLGPVAPELGWVPPIRYLLRRARVLRLLRRISPGLLLEIGCGNGALLHELAQLGHQATGLETSARAHTMANAIAQAGQGCQQVVDQPADDWAQRFDLVCAFDVLEHIEGDEDALDEWISWLRPAGYFCLSVPAHSHRWDAGDEWAGHYRRYDSQPLKELLRKRGLIIDHFECYGFPLANLTEIIGNRTYRRLLGQRKRPLAKEDASSLSGIDRTEYLRLFHHLDTFSGRMALRLAILSQAMTSKTNLGSGYLVLARRS